MTPETRQRLIGIFLVACSTWLIAFNWNSLLTAGKYWPKASFIGPVFFFLGLMVILYPISKQACLEKYGSEQLSWGHMSVGQKSFIVVAMLAGVVNWMLMSGRI